MRIQLTLLVSCTSQIEYTELLLVNVFNFILETYRLNSLII